MFYKPVAVISSLCVEYLIEMLFLPYNDYVCLYKFLRTSLLAIYSLDKTWKAN